MNPGWRYVVIGTAFVLFAGCQSSPGQLGDPFAYGSVRQQFIDRHLQQAGRFEAKGALREAQREWQLVHALSPTGGDASTQIERLDRKIDRRFAKHLAAAEKAVARRQGRTARTNLLQALALKPDNARAIALMRRNEAKFAYAALESEPSIARGQVSEVDVYVAAEKRNARGESKSGPAAVPMSPAGVGSAVDARMKQGLKYLSRGEYETALAIFERAQGAAGNEDPRLQSYIAQTHQALADRHYDLGVAAFRAARYAEAVREFQIVLRHAPDHHKARFYLSSAQSLQKE